MLASAILLFVFIPFSDISAQQSFSREIQLDWHDFPIPEHFQNDTERNIPFFEDADFSAEEVPLPFYSFRSEVSGPGTLNINVSVLRSRSPEFSVDPVVQERISTELNVDYTIQKERNKYFAVVYFCPIIKSSSGAVLLVEQLRINASHSPGTDTDMGGSFRSGFKENSELSSGNIYKIAVEKEGLYRIDAGFLADQLGVNPSEIPVDRIRVLGNRGGMLPERGGAVRIDDVEEIPSRYVGLGNFFSDGGYLMFYAEGPERWLYDPQKNDYTRPKNIYDPYNYYFIKIDEESRLEVDQVNPGVNAEVSFDYYEYLEVYEEDRINVMGAAAGFYGGGQRWFGDNLSNIRSKDYSSEFDLEGFIPQTPFKVHTEFAIRSNTQSNVRLTVGNESYTRAVNGVSISSAQNAFATLGLLSGELEIGNTPLNIQFDITSTGSVSESWMDFIQIRGSKRLVYTGQPLTFRNSEATAFQTAAFEVENNTNFDLQFWDVTHPTTTKEIISQTLPGGYRFAFNSGELREFIAFHQDQDFPRPLFIEQIENQNLHALQGSELLIVYHTDFENAAFELADHRRQFSGLSVELVDVQKIFNEFGGGSPDPTAIRDFARMFYQRSDDFRFLLLFGDGSYDYKGLMPDLPNQNFIPVYQTKQSLHTITSFPSDDYFALLDDSEGDNLKGAIDIAVGRLPVRTANEASNVVRKIKMYDTNPKSLGDWRLNTVFVADNGDSNLHLKDTRRLVSTVKENHPEYNFDKIYMDAFERVSTPGGIRFPEAQSALNSAINKGAFLVNYLGHGGPSGWAQERVLQVQDIISWNNINKLPLFITATCSFANFDDPAITSAGEHVILNPSGGAFALLTTSRLVFAFSNYRLNNAVIERLFVQSNNEPLKIGEVMMNAKNANSSDTTSSNARKFLLLGDPSQRFKIGDYRVVTTEIDDRPVGTTGSDTLKALNQVEIKGEVRDLDDRLVSDFNGVVEFTLYDKPVLHTTLGQGSGSSPQEFEIQKNVLFKGSATVSQGRFSIEFIVPRDINYEAGFGKASYFAYTDQQLTATGAYEDILIGGSSDNAVEDNEGPKLQLFINDENFVYGGITGSNPKLLVKLEDESGINVTGNSIGHELSAFFDGDFNNKIVLNEFYQAEKDNFRRGTVEYPMSQLEDGHYEVNVVAWDILNNKSEERLEFVVMGDQESVIERMLNYPNPFMTHTEFQFEHNLPPGNLDVRVSVYSLSGRMVKDIHTSVISDGNRVRGINWDGKDDYGDRLANGVYLYKIALKADHSELHNKTIESEFEKLVILR